MVELYILFLLSVKKSRGSIINTTRYMIWRYMVMLYMSCFELFVGVVPPSLISLEYNGIGD